ncbi:RIP metalloprotease RseP [Desulforhopalus singaporensis]|uniref:Zinc metalloprotease n=1 Tax=Desulforhopalus singaporensis TaxID=91360 RepID=A0A1H0RD47_9BACT|nr:RIP metalloprotease RseP [Desulforhopalus singaporensis]SDP27457.1 site-2 protease. Metallo peptidase. MEROPS family M50B [Desulforhopalus singaporensis]
MNTLFAFIIVLGLLIFVHEFGHFIFAKLFGVRVLKFSLGFGPSLVGRKIGETEYVISAFPLGGFVKMYGENPDEQDIPQTDREASFAYKPVWKRFFIVLGGPLFNLLFPVVLFFFIFLFVGVPTPVDTTRIGKVTEDSPAYQSGLQAGDVIVQIDGNTTSSWLDVLESVKNSGGKELSVAVMRGGKQATIKVTPAIDSVKNVFGEEIEQRYMVGIMKADELVYERSGLVESFTNSCLQTWIYISLTVKGFIKIVQQVVPASELGGPILIAQIAGEQMRAGWLNLIYFMGLLSVNLGILNLLPIPVLDGGHLVFLTIEGIRRKPLNERAQIFAQQIGIGLLATLMLFVFYNDIVRLFS